MLCEIRFRFLLPIAQTFSAAIFGGVGLWQRHHILSQPWLGDQTMWETTARFHVWPWPFKFAVLTNVPAFLAGALVEWPIESVWSSIPEWIACLPSLAFVPLLWYWVGARFDAKLQASRRKYWMLMLAFTAVCGLGLLVPGHVSYIPYGVLVWLVFTVVAKRRGAQDKLLLPTTR
ncbi:MAG TPA: hypothetical protein VD837_18390 [Terriglobales bacterium]|nr:hypothetical protein [Terriglobales bacterium]